MATASFPATMPGPHAYPLLGARGNLLPFYRDPIGFAVEMHRRYGDLVAWVRTQPGVVWAFDAHHNRQLLSDADLFNVNPVGQFRLPPDSAFQRLSSGLIAMNGQRHRQQRRLMLPAFHRRQVELYRDDMVRFTAAMLDRWRGGETRSVAHEMQQLTMQIATRTLFGLDLDDGAAIGELIKRGLATNMSLPTVLFQYDVPGSPFRRALRIAEQIDALIRRLIARKRSDPAEQHDVIAMLMRARDEDGSRLTDDELIGQAYTLFVAGHETTSNTLTWTLLLLAQHPAVLSDLLDELDGTLHGAPPTVEQLNRLPLLDAVIKESLRLLPPASFLPRTATAPFTMGSYELPKGTTIIWCPYITHRDPDVFPDPQRFKPDRWNALAPSPYEYLPFGAGAHLCIGATFAQMELKIVLAMLLQRFGLQFAPGTVVDRTYRVTLSPAGGLPMTVQPPDRKTEKIAIRGNIHQMVEL